MRNKTLMIVAAGFGQMPAIILAKKMRLRVIAIDKDPNAVGMTYADVALPIDVTDVEGAIKTAKEYGIDGVMTMQSDLSVPAVGAVVSALNLPGIMAETASMCSDKIKTYQKFEQNKIPYPKFRAIEEYDQLMNAIEQIGLPVVVKPSDSSGSRGVSKVEDNKGIREIFNKAKKYSRSGQIIIQEFIDGTEVGAQVFSVSKDKHYVIIHNDFISSPPYFVPVGHSFPSKLDKKTLAKVESVIIKAINALGISLGPSNVDLIIDRSGQPKILEIGCRIGATCLPELISYHTGTNWTRAAILAALGNVPDLNPRKTLCCASFILESPADGELAGYRIPEEVINDVGLLEVEITAKNGATVNKLRKGTDRIGKIIVTDETVEKAELKAMLMKSKIVINVN